MDHSSQNTSSAAENSNLKTFLVCGMTGVGKSTFINAATGADVSVSDDVESDTAQVIDEGIPWIKMGDTYIELVDTPGFGDSREESESVILRRIATWLVARYMSNALVTGVIFLRPLDKVRVDRLEKMLMVMFKDMVGHNHLDHIFLLTTRWPSTPNQKFETRERDIATRNDMFGLHGQQRIQTLRLQEGYTPEDARQVIDVCAGLEPIVFQIQRELVEEGKTLGQTAAGMKIGADMEEKMSDLEEEVKKAQEYLKKTQEKYKKAEEEKRQADEERNRANEERDRANEESRKAKKEAEDAAKKSQAEREEANRRADRFEKEAEAARKRAAQVDERYERETRRREEDLSRLQADANRANERASKGEADLERVKRDIQDLQRPVEKGFWKHAGKAVEHAGSALSHGANAVVRFVSFGQWGWH